MESNEILKKIQEKFGSPISYSSQCDALAEAIFEGTGERIGTSTLKRMFGLVGEKVTPRTSTMDIIAQYIGYPNYALLVKDLGKDADISMFTPVDGIDVAQLKKGSQIQLCYDPNRLIIMSYTGDYKFIVNESYGSKLQKGDELVITQLAVGFDLLISNVVREGKNLGAYHAAKQYGLKSIEIIS